MSIKILTIAVLSAVLILAVNRIGYLLAQKIKNLLFTRDMKREDKRRERQALDERFEAVATYTRSLQQDIWKLEETVEELSKELNKKETKKNVKKKKRN